MHEFLPRGKENFISEQADQHNHDHDTHDLLHGVEFAPVVQEMAAEIYVTILTGFGLGHLLHYGRELNAMEQVVGIMIVIVLIGLLADKILFSPWEKFMHRRWGTEK